MNTELQIILAIISSNSYSYHLDTSGKKEIGRIKYQNNHIEVDPVNYEKARIIRHLSETDLPIDKVLEIKRSIGDFI